MASIEKNIRMVKVYEEYDSQGEEEEEGLNRKMVLVSKSLMVQIKYRIDDLPEVKYISFSSFYILYISNFSHILCSLVVQWLLQNKLGRPCRLT